MSEPGTVQQAVSRARLQLMLRHPYLASSVARFPLVPCTSTSRCPTFATNGYHILYNPDFARERTPEELQFILAHEVLHCLFGHMDRRGERVPLTWNIAADYVVNSGLVGFGFPAPYDVLLSFRFHGLIAEQVYARLTAPGGDVDPLPSKFQWDLHLDGDEAVGPATEGVGQRGVPVPSMPSALERRRIRKTLLTEMANDRRLPGSVRGSLLEEITRASEPAVDWRTLVANFMSGLRRDDYRLFPFNRKHIWRGLFLPSIGVPSPRALVVAIDTSGSMSSEFLGQFLAELDRLRSVTQCTLTIIQFDTEIQKITELSSVEEGGPELVSEGGTFDFLGRGGTDIRAPFIWIQERIRSGEEPPDAMIVATDGFGEMPDLAPAFRVLWLVPQAGLEEFPFGLVVRVPDEISSGELGLVAEEAEAWQ
ncbi:VWA-like domain-containing protein [Gemmatimonadota bacterium]